MNKFHAKPAEFDGIRFDSQKELARYQELLLLEKAGEISSIIVHPVFPLQEAFVYQGKKEQKITYSPDFSYYDKKDRHVIEEVKGGNATRTTAFEIKRKMFLYRYPEYDYRII